MASEINIPATIATLAFQQLWNVCKDKIDICRVCEYRYMCNDPRIPVQRKDGSYYHTTECCYNPYIGKWEEEAGYCSLAECGVICDAAGLNIDMTLLASIVEKVDSV